VTAPLNVLAREIAAIIEAEGPISLELFMTLALGHPLHGYYRRHEPIGAQGDFITAPEVHQMFGELIGLWVLEMWRLMGEPAPFNLIELGPGRGTLMADALRAARLRPAFLEAMSLHLVETNEPLRQSQAHALAAFAPRLAWHETIDDLPPGPCLIIANEFFDALPVRQYVGVGKRWHERLVGLDAAGQLAFGMAPEPEPSLAFAASPGAILELGLQAQAVMGKLATRIAAETGALLMLDYGADVAHHADTLQALRRHEFVDALSEPGETDLTVHVAFDALAEAARRAGAAVHGPVTQGEFLARLGIFERAAQLARNASEVQRVALDRALDRLARPGPAQGPNASMAEIFKVLAVTSANLPMPPGFSSS